MTRAQFIKKVLNTYFPNPKIPLKHKDNYTLLIATLLSAQATDAKVNEITAILFKKASCAKKMLKLSLKELENIIKPCGLYRNKAKNILKLSKMLVEHYNSKVPSTFEDLESLPGIGHKTASVVMSHAFKIPAFPVDTHIHRCAKRWGLSNGKNVKQTEKDLKKLFLEKDWNKLHLQIIYFARKYCPARAHKKQDCPICSKL